jgi:hypothetical protein
MTTSQTDSLVSRAFDELREETAASILKFRDSHVKSGAMDLGTALYAGSAIPCEVKQACANLHYTLYQLESMR